MNNRFESTFIMDSMYAMGRATVVVCINAN